MTPGRLNGKVCLVTGAAQGIGRAVALAYLREGARVVATDLSVDGLSALGSHPGLTVKALDVTDAAAVAAAAADHPEVEVLVNCVGWVADGTILDDGVACLQRSLTINVMSMAATISAFLPAMLDRGVGSIINIASVVSSVKAAPSRFAYATSKAAVLGLTKSVALDFIGKGVRCNAISPGTIDTPSLAERLAAQPDPDAARGAFIARQPMGRLGAADEIAAVAVLLASDEARFMSGENIVIDGGMSL